MKEQTRDSLQRIFHAGLSAADPGRCVKQALVRQENVLKLKGREFDLDSLRKVVLIGAGKAGAPMAAAVEDILGDRLSEGLVVVKYGHALPLAKSRVISAGHPIPDHAGLEASSRILELLRSCEKDDLVIFVFSGGGSALLPSPRPGLTLQDEQDATRILIESGATIDEINAIRKHLSLVKGGGLAKAAYPSTVVSLILSDVVGDRLDVIASGPTVGDSATFADCIDVIDHYALGYRIPQTVLEFLVRGVQGLEEETPKQEDPLFDQVTNIIVGNNRGALNAAAAEARILGYAPLILTSMLEGEAAAAARVITAVAKEIRKSGCPVEAPACLLAGGETTVTVHGSGTGGRNQELALSAAVALNGWKGITLLSAGTDGTDGETDAAGAMVDGGSCAEAKHAGLDVRAHLLHNDSHPLLDRLGLLVRTGPTMTNVMDIICVLVDGSSDPVLPLDQAGIAKDVE